MNPMAIFAAVQGVLGAVGSQKPQNTASTNADQDARLSFAQMLAPLQNMPGSGQNAPGEDDQAVSAADRATRRAELFRHIDANGDGQISKDELKAFRDSKLQESKTALLQLQEALNGGDARKTDGKRKKTPLEELLDAITNNAQQAQKGRGHDRHPHGKGMDHLFSRLDTDGNGLISQAEFVTRGQPAAVGGTVTAQAVTPVATTAATSAG